MRDYHAWKNKCWCSIINLFLVKCGLNNTQVDNARDLDVVILMCNLTEYSNNFAKTPRRVWQDHKDGPNDNITDSESFKFKERITGRTPAAGNTKDAEIAVPLKYSSNFWMTLLMPLTNCKINLMLTWSANGVLTDLTGAGIFAITSTKMYIPAVTLLTPNKTKLL